MELCYPILLKSVRLLRALCTTLHVSRPGMNQSSRIPFKIARDRHRCDMLLESKWLRCSFCNVCMRMKWFGHGPGTHKFTHTPMHTDNHTPRSTHTHTHAHTHTYAHTHTHTYTHIHTHIQIHTNTYIHIHTYQYIHTNTYILLQILFVANRAHTSAIIGWDAHVRRVGVASQHLRPRCRFDFETFGIKTPNFQNQSGIEDNKKAGRRKRNFALHLPRRGRRKTDSIPPSRCGRCRSFAGTCPRMARKKMPASPPFVGAILATGTCPRMARKKMPASPPFVGAILAAGTCPRMAGKKCQHYPLL